MLNSQNQVPPWIPCVGSCGPHTERQSPFGSSRLYIFASCNKYAWEVPLGKVKGHRAIGFNIMTMTFGYFGPIQEHHDIMSLSSVPPALVDVWLRIQISSRILHLLARVKEVWHTLLETLPWNPMTLSWVAQKRSQRLVSPSNLSLLQWLKTANMLLQNQSNHVKSNRIPSLRRNLRHWTCISKKKRVLIFYILARNTVIYHAVACILTPAGSDITLWQKTLARWCWCWPRLVVKWMKKTNRERISTI